MAEDISRNTIYVLVVLTLLISVLGTWTVLSQVNAPPSPSSGPSNVAQANMEFKIVEPPKSVVGEPVTGNAVFMITEPAGGS